MAARAVSARDIIAATAGRGTEPPAAWMALSITAKDSVNSTTPRTAISGGR